jgi:D-aspartate ligase
MTDTIIHPVLILGGQENALSLTRSFGRRNIPVYVAAPSYCFALRSRYCRKGYPIPLGTDQEQFWFDLLLSNIYPELKNSVIMVGSDEAIEFLAHHKAALAEHYLVDDFIPELTLAMLDKPQTLALGKKAGCPTPAFHTIESIEDVKKIVDTVIYPIMLKPVHSHLFCRIYKWKKYLIANDCNELLDKATTLLNKNLEFIVTEIIPGPDDLQSSYHTYINAQGEELFQYTHQIVRRYPKNSGSGCLHVTKWLPDTAEMGKQFFNGIGYRGMGHIEFKYDTRDQKLKIIECNPRFSAAQSLVVKSGLDMAYIIYCHVTGQTLPEKVIYKNGARRWMVAKDLFSFRELHRLGEITLLQWLQSIIGLPLAFPYFSVTDPWPFLSRVCSDVFDVLTKRVELPVKQ